MNYCIQSETTSQNFKKSELDLIENIISPTAILDGIPGFPSQAPTILTAAVAKRWKPLSLVSKMFPHHSSSVSVSAGKRQEAGEA